jgi:hypothetical protein
MSNIPNYYLQIPKSMMDDEYRNPNKNFPLKHPFTAIIDGPTNSGKTNIAVHILNESRAFERLFIVSALADEVLYKFIKHEMTKNGKKDNFIITSSVKDLPTVKQLQKTKHLQTLIIFDDLINGEKKELQAAVDYYTMGRKASLSSIFLTQAIMPIPIVIRQNARYLIILKQQDLSDLDRIFQKYVIGKANKTPEYKEKYETVHEMYRDSTKEPHDFLLIDKQAPADKPKFYHGFENYYNYN